MSGGYAWIVTNTVEDAEAGDSTSASLIELPEDESQNGTTGPADAPEPLLREGKGRPRLMMTATMITITIVLVTIAIVLLR